MSLIEQLGCGRVTGPSGTLRRHAGFGAAISTLLALAGCSLLRPHASPVAAAAPPVAQDTRSDPAAPQTDTDVIADNGPTEPGTSTVMAASPVELKPTAPRSYVVQRGDTLWGISNMFLRNPWQWPEIWYVNPQIHNPHRIYPGDTVRLALGTNGRTVLQIVPGPAARAAARLEPMLRSTALDAPIDAIPYGVIASFISHPDVLTHDQIARAPYIVALGEDHDIAGTGHEIYVRQLQADAGARFSVMHIDEPLVDPESGRHLGYVAIYTGTAEITRPGPVAEAVLTGSARETLQGDVLVPQERTSTQDFIPHTPSQPVAGQIIDVVDNVQLAGQYQVVVLNRGSDAGLDRGSVLTVDQEAMRVPDRCANINGRSTCLIRRSVTLPTDPAATVLVFRSYPRLSYALIMSDTVPVQVGDHVRSP
jgi:hypothetical protein